MKCYTLSANLDNLLFKYFLENIIGKKIKLIHHKHYMLEFVYACYL